MAKWKLLHIVGGESSVGQIRQLAGQYRLLPEELFEQTIGVGEARVARQVEQTVLQPVARLGRRMKIEYSAARNLHRLARSVDPDLIVCWDIQATEQLRLVYLGRRRRPAAAVMLFHVQTDPQLLFKLRSNFRHLDLHVLCGSHRLAQWARDELAFSERTHCVYPLVEKAAENVDRSALRRQMGLEPEAIAIFIPTEGALDDVHNAVIGCGIIERIEPRTRIVILGNHDERAEHLQTYARSIIVPRILHVVSECSPGLAIAGCDLVVQPVTRPAETLALLDAFGHSVPVVSSMQAEPAELMAPGETFHDIGRGTGRMVATGIYKLLTDQRYRQALTEGARAAVERTCGPLEYRTCIVKLYQQLLSPQVEALTGS